MEQAAFAAAARVVSPAVVQIETFGGLERVGQELISDGPTTGTVIDADGWIISSLYSFRQQPASILVSLSDGSRVPARIVARDTSRELALLKVEASQKLTVAVACPRNEVSVGQWAIAMGRTFERDAVSQSVGIISALDRVYGKAIQTDAKVSPVNYGGPLIDLQGRTIGILAPISPGAILEGDSSQLYDSGIGFAVPLVDILQRLPQMKAGQDVHSGRLGIVVADQNELAGPVKVAGAAPGSPAAKAGLKPGDTIVAATGRKVELLAHLRHALGVTDAGAAFSFSVRRGDKTVDLECTLVEQIPTYRLRYLGIEGATLQAGGVQITKIWPQTPAAAANLVQGMVIRKCGDVDVENRDQLRQQVSLAELDLPLQLTVSQSSVKEAANVQVAVTATVWPTKMEASSTSGTAAGDSNSRSELKIDETDLTLGDFPNKAWAWLPKASDAGKPDQAAAQAKAGAGEATAADNESLVIDHGLLILLPEPGDIDRNKLREIWTPLLQAGWCIAVIQSAEKTRWSAEEIELVERVRLQVADRRKLDKARTVVGGVGVGGRLALVGARAARGQVAGVLMLGTALESVRVQRENSPSESLHFLAVGQRDNYRDFIEQLRTMGYPAVDLPVPEFTPAKWDTVPVDSIVQWLLSLGRI